MPAPSAPPAARRAAWVSGMPLGVGVREPAAEVAADEHRLRALGEPAGRDAPARRACRAASRGPRSARPAARRSAASSPARQSVPARRNQAAPKRAISATCASVSTFWSSVGRPSDAALERPRRRHRRLRRPAVQPVDDALSPRPRRSGPAATRAGSARRRAPSTRRSSSARSSSRARRARPRERCTGGSRRRRRRARRALRRRARGAARPRAGSGPSRSPARPPCRSRRRSAGVPPDAPRGACDASGTRRRRGLRGRTPRARRASARRGRDRGAGGRRSVRRGAQPGAAPAPRASRRAGAGRRRERVPPIAFAARLRHPAHPEPAGRDCMAQERGRRSRVTGPSGAAAARPRARPSRTPG